MDFMDIDRLILASHSPRRKYLLESLGFQVEVRTKSVEEVYHVEKLAKEQPLYLAEKKANSVSYELESSDFLIAADTLVIQNDLILGKPQSEAEAYSFLRKLSGKAHEVITGVCLLYEGRKVLFSASTKVFFRELTDREIQYYIKTYKPFDKAGAYGIQEWIGYVGVERIEGCYYNVMGLPLAELYKNMDILLSKT